MGFPDSARGGFRQKSSLHLYEFINASKPLGQGQTQAMEQHFLGFVRRGDAA